MVAAAVMPPRPPQPPQPVGLFKPTYGIAAPITDPLRGPLGDKFKFVRRSPHPAVLTTVPWDPDTFVRPVPPGSAPVRVRPPRRRISADIPTEYLLRKPNKKEKPASQSFKTAAPSNDPDDSDSEDDCSMPDAAAPDTSWVPKTDPTSRRDIEIKYAAVGWRG